MAQQDSALHFRAFLDELLAVGDAVAIDTPVDPHLEVGAVTRRAYETRAPAPLFTSLTGSAPGFRILGAPAGLSSEDKGVHGRLAAHLGLPRESAPRAIVEKLVAAMHARPVEPTVVTEAPCKQNIRTGDAVDLEEFPVPLLHQEDGGRYFGTYGFHVVRSPEGDWTSWSVARTMLHDRNTLVGPAMPQQHIGMVHAMWRERGEPTPWAMVLGAPPAALAAAGMPLPAHVNEDGYVGALTGHPVEVVRTETNGLYVPADAEIVLEGYLSQDETAPEGPMGEYHGYAFAESKQQPVFHVEAVTYRDDPVLPVCAAGLPPEENHTIWGTMISAAALDVLRAAQLPIDMAWCSYEAATCWIVLSVDLARLAERRTTEAELVRDIAEVLFASHAGWLVPKVVLVGNDIDITDIDQVVWALATRHHPTTGSYPFPEAPGIPMVPYLTSGEARAARGGKSVVSCLQPEQFHGSHRGTTASFHTSYPRALRERVLANWAAYGYR
ncbi:UbiD family decarboxylase [Streptomyces iconiensis]|uniref:Pyrrole-2-carboxylic acid decarboxylase n=1 Tax=Streptomyces iconiensis TaxID=1384038 RepID=A0ABT6ZUN4_9ACTN|nr:UbiD family decarboxylase [Streptomyces iconiensis]MDJ1132764.1 UbiD family decarboxylase [Streptomyces iconiensis]